MPTPQFGGYSDFSDGLACVTNSRLSTVEARWGYIDKTGRFVIKPQFDWDGVLDFSEGLASVRTRNKWSYVDKTGKFVITPQFDDASNFSEGLAGVVIGDKSGYINRTGQIVIES